MRSKRLPTRMLKVVVAASAITVAGGACGASSYQQVGCSGSAQSIFILAAQAVPSATYIPCLAPLPPGWSYGGSKVKAGSVRFWLNSDRAGRHAAELTMSRTCHLPPDSKEVGPTDGTNIHRYEEPTDNHPEASVLHFTFPGGCITYRFSFPRRAAPALFDEADHLLGFTPRSVYVNGVREDDELTLCGAGAPPCPG